MNKQSKLEEFKKEYLEDIELVDVVIGDLNKQKITSQVLESEVLLRGVFGDEIYTAQKFDGEISGEKSIVKLTEEDMVLDNQVREICGNLVDSVYDNNINVLLSKIKEEEEE